MRKEKEGAAGLEEGEKNGTTLIQLKDQIVKVT